MATEIRKTTRTKWVTHTPEELQRLIDAEIESRLHMSRKQYDAKRAKRALPDTVAVRDIEMLLKLAEQ